MKYRNKVDVKSQQGILVDAESLWYLEGDVLVLDDEDQYITHTLDRNIFYVVLD